MRNGGGYFRISDTAAGRKPAADFLENVAQLRLEQNHNDHDAEFCRFAENKADHIQLKDLRQPEGDQKQQQTLSEVIGIRLPRQENQPVDQKSDNQNINYIGNSNGLYIVHAAA